MISNYYKLLNDKIENLDKICKGNDPKSRFFKSQLNQFINVFDKFISKIIDQNTLNRQINQSLTLENQAFKKEIKFLKAKLGVKEVKKGYNDRTFPFIK